MAPSWLGLSLNPFSRCRSLSLFLSLDATIVNNELIRKVYFVFFPLLPSDHLCSLLPKDGDLDLLPASSSSSSSPMSLQPSSSLSISMFLSVPAMPDNLVQKTPKRRRRHSTKMDIRNKWNDLFWVNKFSFTLNISIVSRLIGLEMLVSGKEWWIQAKGQGYLCRTIQSMSSKLAFITKLTEPNRLG